MSVKKLWLRLGFFPPKIRWAAAWLVETKPQNKSLVRGGCGAAAKGGSVGERESEVGGFLVILCDTMPSAVAISRERAARRLAHSWREGGKSSQSQIMVGVCSKMPRRERPSLRVRGRGA